MTESPESRACRRYAELAAAVDKATREIGDALIGCRRMPQFRSANMDVDCGELHLTVAYSLIVTEDHPSGWGSEYRPPNEEEVDDFLSNPDLDYDNSDTASEKFDASKIDSLACPSCLKAHQLIQQRKTLRIQFGAAKRAVRQVGKRIIREIERNHV